MIWYKNPQIPFHERETYCSHRLNEFELKILIRKPRAPISIMEAIQLPFCSLTWTSIFTVSASGIILTYLLRKTYDYLQHSAHKTDLIDTILFFYMIWFMQGHEFVNYFRSKRNSLGYIIIIFILLASLISNLYSGIVASFFTVRRLPTIPRSLMEFSSEQFLDIPIVTHGRDFAHNLCTFHSHFIEPLVRRFKDINSSMLSSSSTEKASYELLMRKVYCISTARTTSFSIAVLNITFGKHISAYNFPERKVVNISLGDFFGFIDHKPEIEALSKFAKFLEQ